MFFDSKMKLPSAETALPGREQTMPVPPCHFVSGQPLVGPFPSHCKMVQFGMGCFWGAERIFWNLKGVYVTSVGYSGGFTPNPTYEEVCSGKTGHAEVVQVVFDKQNCNYSDLLKLFFESHNPTQGLSLIHI